MYKVRVLQAFSNNRVNEDVVLEPSLENDSHEVCSEIERPSIDLGNMVTKPQLASITVFCLSIIGTLRGGYMFALFGNVYSSRVERSDAPLERGYYAK